MRSADGSSPCRIWRRAAGRDYPAMAVVQVVRLWDEEAMVELDGFAVLP